MYLICARSWVWRELRAAENPLPAPGNLSVKQLRAKSTLETSSGFSFIVCSRETPPLPQSELLQWLHTLLVTGPEKK